jgi:hypothetical protein
MLKLVEEELASSELEPLGMDFLLVLYQEGAEGLKCRLELAMGLGAVMSRQGIVINAQYMHLRRSIVLCRFPSLEGYRQATGYRRRLLRQVARDLPAGLRRRKGTTTGLIPSQA